VLNSVRNIRKARVMDKIVCSLLVGTAVIVMRAAVYTGHKRLRPCCFDPGEGCLKVDSASG
jgi:hypothetical protein